MNTMASLLLPHLGTLIGSANPMDFSVPLVSVVVGTAIGRVPPFKHFSRELRSLPRVITPVFTVSLEICS